MAIEYDKVDGKAILIWGLLCCVVIYLCVIVLDGFFHSYQNDKTAEAHATERGNDASRLKFKQLEELQSGRKLENGRTTRSIDETMTKVVEQERTKR